jgi:hypothetical protein
MPSKNLTTKKDYRLFRKEVLKWQAKLGLADWRLDFFHQDSDNDDKTRGWFCHRGSFVANIGLSKNWGEDEITNEKIKETALHEILHTLLGEIMWLAENRNTPQGLGDIEEHRIIRRLESAFLGGDAGASW